MVTFTDARIFFCHHRVPKYVQACVETIIWPTITKCHKNIFFSIVDTLCNKFSDVLEDSTWEDDNVEVIVKALKRMNNKLFKDIFCF